MPGMTRAVAVRPEEDALLGRPRQATLLTAAVVAVTAVVFALVADHGTLAGIQRVDDAWLRLMISGRTAPLTAIAKVLNVLGLSTSRCRYGLPWPGSWPCAAGGGIWPLSRLPSWRRRC